MFSFSTCFNNHSSTAILKENFWKIIGWRLWNTKQTKKKELHKIVHTSQRKYESHTIWKYMCPLVMQSLCSHWLGDSGRIVSPVTDVRGVRYKDTCGNHFIKWNILLQVEWEPSPTPWHPHLPLKAVVKCRKLYIGFSQSKIHHYK